MKQLFTPWTVVEKGRVGNDPPESYEVVDSRRANIADANSVSHARLIAAAPDLLEACKAMVSASRTCGYDCEQGKVMDAQKMAEAAIVKAESPANDAGEGEEK